MAGSGNKCILYGELLRSVVKPLLAELGASNRNRVEQVLLLSVDEKIRLSDCLSKLFPDLDQPGALKVFTNLRSQFNQAAEEKGVELRFLADNRKRDKPSERFCWFEGADPAFAHAAKFSDELTADIVGDPLVAPRGIVTTGSAMAARKRVVRFFLSYAHENEKLAEKLLKEFRIQFKPSRRYELEIWIDRNIMVGEHWHKRIQSAIKDCDFGLLLVSPAFLGSDYIGEHELPHFVGEGKKPVIPVGLIRVDFGNHDLKGLGQHQIFLKSGQFYENQRATEDQRAFVHDLFLEAEKRLNQWFEGASANQPAGRKMRGDDAGSPEGDDLVQYVPVPEESRDFQRTRGIATTLAGLLTLDGKAPARDQARDAIEELEAWATNAEAPPFFALLGEYGIGKTTTLKQFTRHLLDKLKKPQAAKDGVPLPIFVDLRDYVGERKDHVPTIEELLDEVIRRSWKLTERVVTAKDILRLVREEGALIIFDGLDEKIVHLTPEKARAFIRTLWAVLPDAARGKHATPTVAGIRRGRMILSCRSHYFRDVMSQNAMLVGEDREGLDAKSYPALCLLPFTEEQIRGYLESCLKSPEHGRAAFDLIARVHNLPELAQRPYLLSLISGQLEQLETLSVRGETVNAARLYDLFVRSWLNRDDGKHQLNPTHKRRLMEDLAAAMWREGSKQWDVDRLENWLDDFLADHANRALAGAYQNKERDVLKEDLRTATFVLRPDTEEKHFRFAHTSLQEFFLAGYLTRALRERASQRWDLPMPTLETLDFLGQILDWDNLTSDIETLNTVLGDSCLRAATVAFRYWLMALEKNLPVPQPARVHLAGADLEEWQVRGPSPAQPLNLRGANFSGARFNRARLENVDLSGSDLTGVEARQSLFLNVQAARAKVLCADFAGLQWRGGTLLRSDLTDACLSGCQWIDIDLTEALLPADWTRQACAVDLARPQETIPGVSLVNVIGHGDRVNTCAWSPDSTQLASAGDHTVKVWDAASGQCLLTLQGHQRRVTSCAWNPDGTRLASAGDHTVMVWDATSGRSLLTLQGHQKMVTSCAWSPDGMRLVSGSADNNVKVWDAVGGLCLLNFQGHQDEVTSCAWSPDSMRLVSGSKDKTAKVWDAASGECVLTFQGHKEEVTSCAWSPDGMRLVSGSKDETAKVWDAASGECLLTFQWLRLSCQSCAWSPDGTRLAFAVGIVEVWDATSGQCLLTIRGHKRRVTSCAWSPDGTRLASGSLDSTVKLWDSASGQCLLTLQGNHIAIWSCAWNPDGTRLASASKDNTVKVWDSTSGQCLLSLQAHQGEVGFCTSCAWSPDGTRLVSAADDTLQVWDSASGLCLFAIHGDHKRMVISCAWSPDGTRLASSGDTVQVWDASSGKCLLTLHGHQDGVWSCAWSPDGTRLAFASEDNTVKVWDASSGQCLSTLQGHLSLAEFCAWSPDGTRLVCSYFDNIVKVWDAVGGQCLLTLQGYLSCCTWSPDGSRLVSGCADHTVKVWDAVGGQCLLTLEGHQGEVMSCAWSPDSTRLVSGSADSTVKVWDVACGVCLWTGHLLPDLQAATIDAATNRVTHASPEAWRFLGWRWFDPDLGRLRLLPAEIFGPLPS